MVVAQRCGAPGRGGFLAEEILGWACGVVDVRWSGRTGRFGFSVGILAVAGGCPRLLVGLVVGACVWVERGGG